MQMDTAADDQSTQIWMEACQSHQSLQYLIPFIVQFIQGSSISEVYHTLVGTLWIAAVGSTLLTYTWSIPNYVC